MIALVTGGASSGKSAYAEQLALSLPGPHAYVATMRHGDAETERRIERHREARRGRGFTTIELAEGDPIDTSARTVLVEDLGNLVANGLTDALEGLLAFENAVFVGNEVGGDGAQYDHFTRAYIEQIGGIARTIADAADTVVEVVVGIPNVVRGAADAAPQHTRSKEESHMMLVVGGLSSGKREFARRLGYSDGEIAELPLRSPSPDDVDLEELASRSVVICTEVGSGIVPIDPDERAWRERAGRLSAELARRANTVVRMVCGVPTVLKGEIPWS